MSTKDIIERLNRSSDSTTPRTRGTGTAVKQSGSAVQTRVGARVIRRRRQQKPDPQAAPPRPTIPATAAAEAEAPEASEATPDTPPVEAPAEADAKQTASEEAATTAPEAKAAETVEEAKAADKTEDADEKKTATKAKAKSKPTAKAKSAAKSKTKSKAKEEKDSETSVEAAEAQSPDQEVVASEDEGEGDKVPATAKAEEAVKQEDTADASAEPAADAKPARPTPPRLSKTKDPEAFPGLGSAVVRPPPGYDPSDPTGNRLRAKQAAAESSQGADGSAAGKKEWRDQSGTDDADKKERRKERAPRQMRKHRRARVEMHMDDFVPSRRRRGRGKAAGPKKQSPQAKAIKRRVEVDSSITVAQLAHGMSVKTSQVIKSLMGMGQMVTANEPVDFETATLVGAEFEYEIVNSTFDEDAHFIQVEESTSEKSTRPPVVTIMGHVDHGKTTLLDTVRQANVASGEAGGITQHIGAYQVERNGKLITFIDTPGHEAFTGMRARGAQVTDIVILVVAANDGVMPQTIEAYNHAKAAGVEIIVAVNKCDVPGVSPDRIRQELMQYELVPEEYGGDTMFVNISALKGDGIDELLDSLLLVAEVGEYTAVHDRHAEGNVLEARVARGRGTVATLLVKEGTLERGNILVLGTTWGRIRNMTDHKGDPLKVAGPATPVEVTGLQTVPQSGDDFVVVKSEKDAKALVKNREDLARAKAISGHQRVTLEDLMALGQEQEKVQLNLIVKTDVGGTLEAIKGAFDKVEVEGTSIKILHASVGGITESDVTLAHTYGAIIIGFNVRPDANARKASDAYNVEIRTYQVIYEAIEEIEQALKGMLGPTIKEKIHGLAEIRQTFKVPKVGTIAGCMVLEGKISRSYQVRLLRDSIMIWEGQLGSLRRFKDDVKEVEKGYECGMNLAGFNDIKVGDHLEVFAMEAIKA